MKDLSDKNSLVISKEEGQTLIEFLLLLASIVTVAYSFMRIMNTNIADDWQRMAQLLLEDEAQVLEIR